MDVTLISTCCGSFALSPRPAASPAQPPGSTSRNLQSVQRSNGCPTPLAHRCSFGKGGTSRSAVAVPRCVAKAQLQPAAALIRRRARSRDVLDPASSERVLRVGIADAVRARGSYRACCSFYRAALHA